MSRLVGWLGLPRSKFYAWRGRYGRADEHNALVPRDCWLEDWERAAIAAYAGEVHVPSAVDGELGEFLPDWAAGRPPRLQVGALTATAQQEATSWAEAGLLHAGEAEAVALARATSADWLLTDDLTARLFAQSVGLEVHGSLGIVLWAAAVRLLDRPEAVATLDRLARTSLWLSEGILREAQAALDERFS